MAKVNLDKMSLEELKTLKSDVEKAIADYEDRKRAEAMAEMEEVARKHGFSPSELVGGTGRKAKSGSKAKAPAKYRNPENSDQTWSGRGRQPAWFKDAVESGTSPDKMAI